MNEAAEFIRRGSAVYLDDEKNLRLSDAAKLLETYPVGLALRNIGKNRTFTYDPEHSTDDIIPLCKLPRHMRVLKVIRS